MQCKLQAGKSQSRSFSFQQRIGAQNCLLNHMKGFFKQIEEKTTAPILASQIFIKCFYHVMTYFVDPLWETVVGKLPESR